MMEESHLGRSDEEAEPACASSDASQLHEVARRIQLREHASRQQQLQLHKQLQQQQVLLQQQQQQLHQQGALLRHQEQLLRQQEQQLASRETEAGLLLRQVALLQQQLDERADRLAAAEGNYLNAASLLQRLQQRVTLGDEARLLVEEVRQQQQQDSSHLYAEVRRLRWQLWQQIRASEVRNKERETDHANDQYRTFFEAYAAPTGAGEAQQQQQQQGEKGQQQLGDLALPGSLEKARLPFSGFSGFFCCAEAADAAACTAWASSASCCCSSDVEHEAAVDELRAALQLCHSALDPRRRAETPEPEAAGAKVMAVHEAVLRCPAAGADAEIVAELLERLRAESMQIRVYAQQRSSATAAAAGSSSTELKQQRQKCHLTLVEESVEREAYDVMGAALPQEVLLPLLSVQSLSALLKLKQQSVLLANSRWLQLLKETVAAKFLEGSSCCARCSSSSGNSSSGSAEERMPGAVSPKAGVSGDLAGSGCEGGERRQHVLLQLLLHGCGGVAAAAALLRQSTAPITLHAALMTDRESGNNVFHLLCLRNLPQLFGLLGLTSLPSELLYAQNKQGKTPSDLLPSLQEYQVLQLQELHEAAAAGNLQLQTELQQQVAAVTGNLRAWRSVVFEYAAKASSLYRQHSNEAALSLYTEALKLQQKLLRKQQQLDEATGGNAASSLSLLENTAKLAFNKARSALRLGQWSCCLQSCSLCLSMTPNYKAAYETAAQACEWLLDFEGALNYIHLMRQHCPNAFSNDHVQKRRLYVAQLKASSFQVLGLDRGAPKAAVNRAFRRMSILWHPDKASALSDDLRLRHENHFKRLNEARISLLDTESYAQQLRVPSQPLYRHPELLVTPKPPPQATPSSALLTQKTQSPRDQNHHEQQLQQQQPEQQKQEEAEPRLEKLRQQRQQLLRSIGSLQRQQHELQRELEEQQAAAPQQTSSGNSPSNSMRRQELQKLQQQQQNKQKKLTECETEIGQWLHRQQQQDLQQRRHQLQPQDEGVDASEADTQLEGVDDSSSPRGQGWLHSDQRTEQQHAQGDNPPHDVSPSDKHPAPQSPSISTAAAAAAAEVINEAAAAAISRQGKGKRASTTSSSSSGTSLDSSGSDTEAPSTGYVYPPDITTSSSCSSSMGFPTVTTCVPSPPRSQRYPCPSIQPESQGAAAVLAPAARTDGVQCAGRARESPRGYRSIRRGGGRASSAGPHMRTQEAAPRGGAATPKATPRRSLTTCIFSSTPRRAVAAPPCPHDPLLPKRNAAYWNETETSSITSNSESSDSCSSDRSADSNTPENHIDKRWDAPSICKVSNFASTTTAAASSGAAVCSSSSSNVDSQQQQQRSLPTPPPRRIPEADGTRRESSKSSSGGSSSAKIRGRPGRRSSFRSRGNQQTQKSSTGEQRQQHREQQFQQQQRQTQQLWTETPGRGVAPWTSLPAVTAARPTHPSAQQDIATAVASSPQVTAAWLRPPKFPEPFSAEVRSHQTMQQEDPEHATPRQHQQQQKPKYGNRKGIPISFSQQQHEYKREKNAEEFTTPAMLPNCVDVRRMRQQQLEQVLQQQLLLQRKLHQQGEAQDAYNPGSNLPAPHHLLFPDEEVHSRVAAAATAAPGAAAATAAAAAASHQLPPGPPKEAPAPLEAEWATFRVTSSTPAPFDSHNENYDEKNARQPEGRRRWPVPPQCSGGASAADSTSAPLIRPGNTPLPTRDIHGGNNNGDQSGLHPSRPSGVCPSDVQRQQRRNGNHSNGETSSDGECNRGSSNNQTSQIARGTGEPSEASEQWETPRSSFFTTSEIPSEPHTHPQGAALQKQEEQRLHPQRQHEPVHHSVSQETPHLLRRPQESDSIFLMQWGMGDPQRSSVPILGRGGGESSSSNALQKRATATPTRLFPHYDPSLLMMQQAPQEVRLGGPQPAASGERSDIAASAAVASSASGGPVAAALEKARGAGAVAESGNAVPVSRGMLQAHERSEGDASASFGSSWQPLLTRGSLPPLREDSLLHSPSRPSPM